MIASPNDYFDIWNYPTLLLLSWALNVLLALLAAYLLYQAASQAKAAMLDGLSRKMVQALGGKDHDIRMKQVQFIINEVEAHEQGALFLSTNSRSSSRRCTVSSHCSNTYTCGKSFMRLVTVGG